MRSHIARTSFVILVSMFGLTAVAFAAQEAQPPPETKRDAVVQKDQTRKSEEEEPKKEGQVVRYSTEAVVLVVLILVLLAALFYLLLSWSRRREMAGYYGEVYKETVENWEYRRLLAPFAEKWDRGEYHEERALENPRPEPKEDLINLADELGLNYLLQLGNGGPGRTGLPGLGIAGPWAGESEQSDYAESSDEPQERGGEIKKKYAKFHALRREWSKAVRAWNSQIQKEARTKYTKDQAQERKRAKKRAGSAAGDLDLSVLRGRGAEFVLEFTAVVVIIFSAVILGILDILKEQQIGTLLAAIAGYVLGRATTETRGARSEQVRDEKPSDQQEKPKGKARGAGEAEEKTGNAGNDK